MAGNEQGPGITANPAEVSASQQTQLPDRQAVRQQFLDSIGARNTAQTEEKSLIDTTMAGIGELAGGFADAMISLRMPTSLVIENHYSGDVSDPQLLGTTRHPAWIVVEGTNLAGKKLAKAMVIHTHFTYSLGSHSVSGSREKTEEIDPDKVNEYTFGQDDKLHYREDAFAVTSLGLLVSAQRSYYGRPSEGLFPPSYLFGNFVLHRDATPEPAMLFDTSKRVKPERILAAMQRRLDESAVGYAGVQDEEDAETIAKRDLEYYMSKVYAEPSSTDEGKPPKYRKTRIIRRLRKAINS